MSVGNIKTTRRHNFRTVNARIDPQASAEALNKLREVDPNYPIEAETGHNYYSIGNYEKAYENFTKANLNTMEAALPHIQFLKFPMLLSPKKSKFFQIPKTIKR